MRRRTSEEGYELVEKYRASGMAQESFAKKARINVATLRYWLHKSKRVTGDGSEPVRFIELAPALEMQGQSPVVRIETPSGVVLRLEQLPSAEYLVDLVLGLGRL